MEYAEKIILRLNIDAKSEEEEEVKTLEEIEGKEHHEKSLGEPCGKVKEG